MSYPWAASWSPWIAWTNPALRSSFFFYRCQSSSIPAWEGRASCHFFLLWKRRLSWNSNWKKLTREVWHGLELLLPELWYSNALILIGLIICGHSLLISVLQDLFEVFGINSVQNIEEVLTWWTFADRKLVGEVLSELQIFIELWPQVLDWQLVVMGHRDLLHLGLLQEVLIAAQNIFEKILVHDILIWQVVLDWRGIRNWLEWYLRCLSR